MSLTIGSRTGTLLPGQGQRLLAGIGADSDTIVDGGADELIKRFAALEVEVVAVYRRARGVPAARVDRRLDG